MTGIMARWNLLWEAAQYRRRFFDEDELPGPMARIAYEGDANVVFAPPTKSRYHEHALLAHLPPRKALERHGLPLLRAGQCPHIASQANIDPYLPPRFSEASAGQSLGLTIWRHLSPASPIRGFSGTDPIRILAHNLDYWLPPVTEVVQETLRDIPEVEGGNESPGHET